MEIKLPDDMYYIYPLPKEKKTVMISLFDTYTHFIIRGSGKESVYFSNEKVDILFQERRRFRKIIPIFDYLTFLSDNGDLSIDKIDQVFCSKMKNLILKYRTKKQLAPHMLHLVEVYGQSI